MDFLSKSRNRIIVLIALGILVIALQYPFLLADPDINISTSRGANTDEGLYTCQIRNYINQGELGMNDTDGLVKTPLLSGVLYPSFSLFGISKKVARSTVLISFLLLFLHVFQRNKRYLLWGGISTLVVIIQYYIFHFTHFSLAEILSSGCAFISIVYLTQREKHKSYRNYFFAAMFCSFTYYFKIQYIYFIPLLPSILIAQLVFSEKRNKEQFWKIGMTIGFLTLFLAIYLLCWYWPNKELLDFVLTDQTSDRWVKMEHMPGRISYVLQKYFHNKYLIYFSISFYISLVLGLIRLWNKPTKMFQYTFMGLLIWLILELHKLFISYLPTRYIISLILLMGLIITLVTTEYLLEKSKNNIYKILKSFMVLLSLFLSTINIKCYVESYGNRSFDMEKAELVLSSQSFGQAERRKPIIGPWAASLSWNSKQKTLPVWKGYFNDENPIQKLNPAVVISEIDEEDSNQAYSSQGISIDSLSDSIHYFRVNKWELKLIRLDKE